MKKTDAKNKVAFVALLTATAAMLFALLFLADLGWNKFLQSFLVGASALTGALLYYWSEFTKLQGKLVAGTSAMILLWWIGGVWLFAEFPNREVSWYEARFVADGWAVLVFLPIALYHWAIGTKTKNLKKTPPKVY